MIRIINIWSKFFIKNKDKCKKNFLIKNNLKILSNFAFQIDKFLFFMKKIKHPRPPHLSAGQKIATNNWKKENANSY